MKINEDKNKGKRRRRARTFTSHQCQERVRVAGGVKKFRKSSRERGDLCCAECVWEWDKRISKFQCEPLRLLFSTLGENLRNPWLFLSVYLHKVNYILMFLRTRWSVKLFDEPVPETTTRESILSDRKPIFPQQRRSFFFPSQSFIFIFPSRRANARSCEVEIRVPCPMAEKWAIFGNLSVIDFVRSRSFYGIFLRFSRRRL